MAVPAGPTDKRYVGNGVTTIFTIPFLLLAASDLDVFIDGVEVVSGFTVTGVGNPTSTITFAVAPASLADVYLQLNVPFERLNDYQENGDFLSSTVNRDFDRIWQALKQLYGWAIRSLRLGTFDIDGSGWYRAKGNGIRDLNDPVQSQDAATKHSVEAYVASILETGQGPINNAANVVYVYPDGIARSVQSLATKDNPLLGSAGIAHNSGTVRDALVGHDSAITDLNAGLADARKNSSTAVSSLNQLVDMHYGVLRGTGYIAGDLGGTVTTTTTAAVSSGRFIPVANTANFAVGQLICYLANNGEYYSGVIQSKDSTTLSLQSSVDQPISSGSLVSSFYSDVSHPNPNGFRAIADYALRNLGHKNENVITWRAADGYATQGTVTVNQISLVSYENPGSSEFPSIGVTAGSVLAGIVSPTWDLPAGNYLVRVSLTPTLSGSSDPTVMASVGIRETVAGFPTTIGVGTAGGDVPAVVEVAFHKRPNSTFNVVVSSPSSGHQFALAKIEVMRVHANVTSINKGVHVCLGDSWFVNPGLVARLQERLPGATFINKGVGGNRADQLWGRFEADVTPYNPDYVWAMAGTNDVAQGYPIETYSYNMGIVSSKINEIGAEAIMFNCSVGSPTHPTLGDLLTPSRKYAIHASYLSESPDRTKPGFANSKIYIPIALTIPASSTRRVAVFPGTTSRPATLDKLYVIGQSGAVTGNVRYGYGGSAGATISEDLQTVALATTVRLNLVVTKSNASDRFLLIEVENTAASALDVIGFVTATWAPS